MSSPGPKSIAILGGGITGLSAAFRLAAQGHRVRVFEASERVGGAIRSEITDGWLVEWGPNSLQEGSPELAELLGGLNLEFERLEAGSGSKKRYLVRGGRLKAAPLSPPAIVGSSLLSLKAKCRIVSELFARPRQRDQDVSVADFMCEHFGREVLDYAVQPIVSGTWAGDPSRLSTRSAFPKLWEMERLSGSILKAASAEGKKRKRSGALPKLISFRHGLQVLPEAIAASLPQGSVELNCLVGRILHGPRWTVEILGRSPEAFDAVVSTLPARSLSKLAVGSASECPLGSLDQIEYPPLASLFLGYKRGQVRHPLDGFGVLIPALEKRDTLGILFSSSLFPGRAPEGHVALTVMAGGMLQPEVAHLSLPALLASVQKDLKDLLGVSGEPVFLQHHVWPRAIPQYQLGHDRHREAIRACEKAHPGLFIGGQACDGISLPACVAAGFALANRAGSI